MARIVRVGAAALLAVLMVTATVGAQEKSAPSQAAAAVDRKNAQVPLKLQLVLSRYQADKKVASTPYVLWVTTNEVPTKLRMGLQVPVPGGPETNPWASYTFKDVSTNIDCSATLGTDPGVYKVALTVSDSGVSMPDAHATVKDSARPAVPSFRNFTSTFTILLRDGQSAQYTSATDPVSGEVLKIEATLNVLK